VAVALLGAGVLFATSAGTAAGTDLRSDGPDLAGLIRDESSRLDGRTETVAALRDEVQELTAAVDDETVRSLERQSADLAGAAEMVPLTGPGLAITLDDADFDRPAPEGATANDLVVHQQDLQGVVNALWDGGAEGLVLMDQRVISTSAVTCVGSTLRLQGRVYSPPYTIRAVGDVDGMQDALDGSPVVSLYRDYARVFGLGYEVEQQPAMDLPAFEGSLEMQFADVADDGGEA
jgi:uncharacterized protein YlxW (UPF0749 family)